MGGNLDFSSAVQAAVNFCGPGDLLAFATPEDREKYAFPFGFINQLVGGSVDENRELVRQASPVAHVSGKEPPFLLVYGDADPWMPPWMGEILLKALLGAGVEAEMHVVPGGGHIFWGAEVDQKVLAFLNRHVR